MPRRFKRPRPIRRRKHPYEVFGEALRNPETECFRIPNLIVDQCIQNLTDDELLFALRTLRNEQLDYFLDINNNMAVTDFTPENSFPVPSILVDNLSTLSTEALRVVLLAFRLSEQPYPHKFFQLPTSMDFDLDDDDEEGKDSTPDNRPIDRWRKEGFK